MDILLHEKMYNIWVQDYMLMDFFTIAYITPLYLILCHIDQESQDQFL